MQPATTTPLDVFFEQWYVPEFLVRPDQHLTRADYRVQLKHLTGYAREKAGLDPLTLGDLSDQFVKACMARQLEAGRSVHTVNKIHRVARAIAKYAWICDAIDAPLKCRKLKGPKHVPTAWSIDELSRLLAAAETQSGTVGGLLTRIFAPAMLWFLWSTGARINAALQTLTEDFDPETRFVCLRAGVQKQRADQWIRLQPQAVAACLRLRSRERAMPKLFGDWEHRKPPYELLKRVVLDAGLEGAIPRRRSGDAEELVWRKHLFHKFRRTTATHARGRQGEEATRNFLGHAHVSTTRAYIDPRFGEGVDSCELLPALPGQEPEPTRPQLRLFSAECDAG